MADKIVRLNVGGKRYMTTLNTLKLRGPNMLTTMVENDLSGSITSTKDENGYYFIDRNGRIFEIILELLRTGLPIEPTSISHRNRIQEELNFYGIDLQLSDIDDSVPNNNFAQAAKAITLNAVNENSIGKWIFKQWPKMKQYLLKQAQSGFLSADIYLLAPFSSIPTEKSSALEKTAYKFLLEAIQRPNYFILSAEPIQKRQHSPSLADLAAHLAQYISLYFNLKTRVAGSVKYIKMDGEETDVEPYRSAGYRYAQQRMQLGWD